VAIDSTPTTPAGREGESFELGSISTALPAEAQRGREQRNSDDTDEAVPDHSNHDDPVISPASRRVQKLADVTRPG
jgi:hypothetical protein